VDEQENLTWLALSRDLNPIFEQNFQPHVEACAARQSFGVIALCYQTIPNHGIQLNESKYEGALTKD
jgi:hypothetical protein